MAIHGLQAPVPFEVDEMLLRTMGDECGGETPKGTGPPYLDLNINHRRRSEQEANSSRPRPDGFLAHVTTATNPWPYTQHSSSDISYPVNRFGTIVILCRHTFISPLM